MKVELKSSTLNANYEKIEIHKNLGRKSDPSLMRLAEMKKKFTVKWKSSVHFL